MALLLGAAAIVAAIIGARSAALANEAGDAWQDALRTATRRAAAVLEDVRYLYQVEVPPAFQVVGARIQRDEMAARASGAAAPAVADALRLETQVHQAVIDTIEPASDLATDPVYALPGGGLDLGRRLADARAGSPDALALDPDALMATGDERADQASRLMLTLLPVSLAALFGALAQPFARRRGLLLAAGTLALGIGGAAALAMELLG